MRQKAAIVDLDGTLFDSLHRMHFLRGDRGIKSALAWRLEADKDLPTQWCLDLIAGLRVQGYAIIYLTGRNEGCCPETMQCLMKYVPGSSADKLLMRAINDNRKDTIVKQEIYLRDIIPFYQVMLAIEDRPAVAEMWRTLGVTCLHCASWIEDPEYDKKITGAFEESDKEKPCT